MTPYCIFDPNIRTVYTMLYYLASVYTSTLNIFLNTDAEFHLPKHDSDHEVRFGTVLCSVVSIGILILDTYLKKLH